MNASVPRTLCASAPDVDMALQRQAEDDRDDHPANSVVDDGGGEDDLADRRGA